MNIEELGNFVKCFVDGNKAHLSDVGIIFETLERVQWSRQRQIAIFGCNSTYSTYFTQHDNHNNPKTYANHPSRHHQIPLIEKYAKNLFASP